MKLYDKSLVFRENGKTLTLLSLAIPKFFQALFQQLLGTLNSTMLSNVSEAAVAATSVANTVFGTITTILDAFAFGASILVSLALGRKDRMEAGKITSVAICASAILSVPIAIFLACNATPILTLMNADAETLSLSVEYFMIKALYLPITVLGTTLSSLLICNAHLKYAFYIGVASSGLTVLSNYVLLYTGMPISPILAVSCSGVIVTLIFALVRLFFFIRLGCPFIFGFDLSVLKRLLIYGVPGKMSNIAYTFAHTVTTSFIVGMGQYVINTKSYVGILAAYVYMFSNAVASGGTILIGRFLGAKRPDAVGKLYRQNLIIASALNIIFSILLYLFHAPLVGMFTKNPEIIALAREVLIVDIFVELFRAINQVSEQGLNACGKVKTTLVINTVFCWLLSVGLSYVFGVVCGLGLVGVWLAFLVDEVVRSVCYLACWYLRLRAERKEIHE